MLTLAERKDLSEKDSQRLPNAGTGMIVPGEGNYFLVLEVGEVEMLDDVHKLIGEFGVGAVVCFC